MPAEKVALMMAQPDGPTICGLYRYPVKGLSPEPLECIELRTDETLPFDRAYAIENGPGRFNPDHPQYLPKINFLTLMRDERLATLQTKFDDSNASLTILRDGRPVARGQLTTTLGRQMVEQFLGAYMKPQLRGAPKIVCSEGHSFSDVAAKCVHIVNLASVRELERAIGSAVNPLRFRPNIVIDGVAAWGEFNWVNNAIAVGGAKLEVFEKTARCAATNVDPESGKRDMAIPSVLKRTWGHCCFGVYARVSEDGAVAIGNTVTVT